MMFFGNLIIAITARMLFLRFLLRFIFDLEDILLNIRDFVSPQSLPENNPMRVVFVVSLLGVSIIWYVTGYTQEGAC